MKPLFWLQSDLTAPYRTYACASFCLMELPMAVPQGDLAVRITSGPLRMCALFDAATTKKDFPGLFIGKGAVAGSLADCEDASMP